MRWVKQIAVGVEIQSGGEVVLHRDKVTTGTAACEANLFSRGLARDVATCERAGGRGLVISALRPYVGYGNIPLLRRYAAFG